MEISGVWGMIPGTHSVIVMLTKQHKKFLFLIGCLYKGKLEQGTGVMALLGMETPLCAAASET